MNVVAGARVKAEKKISGRVVEFTYLLGAVEVARRRSILLAAWSYPPIAPAFAPHDMDSPSSYEMASIGIIPVPGRTLGYSLASG